MLGPTLHRDTQELGSGAHVRGEVRGFVQLGRRWSEQDGQLTFCPCLPYTNWEAGVGPGLYLCLPSL